MANPTPVRIVIDDRIRLMSAALAASHFPEKAQERKRHHAHAHARATIKYMQERQLNQHPAIVNLQGLLDQAVPLEALFAFIMTLSFPNLDGETFPAWMPEGWNKQLWDFYQKADLGTFWKDNQHSKAWETAEAQAQNAFKQVFFKTVLEPFVGEIPEEFVFMPNICYPADHPLAFRVGNQIMVLVPPPLAWGESAPWPYDEDTRIGEHTYPAALSQYAKVLMLTYLRQHPEKVAEASAKDLPVEEQIKALYPTWEEQFVALFMSAVVAIYLEDHLNPTEARGYMLMEKKVRNLTILPGTVSVLRRYLQERGHKFQELADFLVVFPVQLRVAKKIVKI